MISIFTSDNVMLSLKKMSEFQEYNSINKNITDRN